MGLGLGAEHSECQKPFWFLIRLIAKVTCLPRFLLNASKQRHSATYEGAVDLRLYAHHSSSFIRCGGWRAASVGYLQSSPYSRKDGFFPVLLCGVLWYAQSRAGQISIPLVAKCGSMLVKHSFECLVNPLYTKNT